MGPMNIDMSRAKKKWAPMLEHLGVSQKSDKFEWIAEMAEYHQINESIAYGTKASTAGMGAILSPQPATLPGVLTGSNYDGTNGSGDMGQNLLPVSMKIAAQTIGLDLVAVKPSPGPKIDLIYLDFRYDDTPMTNNDEKTQVFKVQWDASGDAAFRAVVTAFMLANPAYKLGVGRIEGPTSLYVNLAAACALLTTNTVKDGRVEFLGYSRVDGFPMFRAYRQANTTTSGSWAFDGDLNTFGSAQYPGGATPAMVHGNSVNADSTTPRTNALGAAFDAVVSVSLVSALEDDIEGYVSNWLKNSQMLRGDYEGQGGTGVYPGVVAPDIHTRTIQTGIIEVSSAIHRTEIQDIKAATGIDIIQKLESVLVNMLSQKISKDIIYRIKEQCGRNRTSAIAQGITGIGSGTTGFDFNTNYVTALGSGGGETTHAVQRKLITQIQNASNYIFVEGRIGLAQYAVVSGRMAGILYDSAGYTVNPVQNANVQRQLYPMGTIGAIQIYVDPYMNFEDRTIYLGRKNNPDQPGIIFVPYLMAQQISLISEATFAPRMLLTSRYAVADVGFFPEKQFMEIRVTDAAGFLG